MKRTRLSRPKRLSGNAARLIALAGCGAESSSRIEDEFWDAKLVELIADMLEENDEEAFTAALDKLFGAENGSYEILADMIEAGAECRRLSADGVEYDALLLAAPILAWSRFSIPSGTMSKEIQTNIRTQLGAHVLAADVKLAMADFLFSPDQLPDSYCLTADLTKNLAACALSGLPLRVDPTLLRETVQFLSDTRYVLAVVVAPRGKPMFRWQEDDGSRKQALADWQKQGLPCITPMLPACAAEAVLPQAFHAACRDSDRQGRPFSLKASSAFLQTTLNLKASDLIAVVAPFHHERLEEYRISFALKDGLNVVHGVVWPLLDAEDESSDSASLIETVLKECGIQQVRVLEHRFPLEYCDDCGAPLYPSPDGEPVHAEMPETDDETPQRLH